MKIEQSVPKRRHMKSRRRGITQKKAYNRYTFCSVVFYHVGLNWVLPLLFSPKYSHCFPLSDIIVCLLIVLHNTDILQYMLLELPNTEHS